MSAKLVKTKKKNKINIFIINAGLFIFGFFLLEKFFFKPYLNSVNAENNLIANKIALEKQNNEKLKLEIKELSSYNRVMNIAQQAGLELNVDNIMTVIGN